MSYDKSEVDALVASLNSRIDTSNVTLSTVNSAVTAHNASPDAHNTIFVTKALKTTVSELSDTVDDLTLRIQNLENISLLKGTLSYSLSGKAGETPVSIEFDIEPIDEDHPVTYEVYGDGYLLPGLTFDAAAGTITGTPIAGGTATYVVLAKSGNYGAFITISQNFEGEPILPSAGYEALSAIVTKLRTNDIDDLVMGTEYTITMADETEDTSRTLTYNNLEYVRYPAGDIDTLYAWACADSRIYTDEIAIVANAMIKDATGTVIGTLPSTPSYMKDYRIILTSVDTDDPTAGTYAHNARFEFLDVVGTRVYDSDDESEYEPSEIRAYLTSTAADGFIVRLPADIRGLIVPNNIECRITNGIETLSDKVFLPSAYELCGTTNNGRWHQEGTKSTYYPASWEDFDSSGRMSTRIRYTLSGGAQRWWTRTPDGNLFNHFICIDSNGSVSLGNAPDYSRVVAPAFVIA